MSQKVSYAYKKIDTVINGFSPNDVSSHFYICDHSMDKFGMREKILGLSNTSYVEGLYSFIKLVVHKVKFDIIFFKIIIIKEKVWKYYLQMNHSKHGFGWYHNIFSPVICFYQNEYSDTKIVKYSKIHVLE